MNSELQIPNKEIAKKKKKKKKKKPNKKKNKKKKKKKKKKNLYVMVATNKSESDNFQLWNFQD